ncbi:MAG: Uma2 family endonuclease [Deltaproteobacteria bacterium]|nr:Uma2 family endonuclease [Deltaproteobacteria bacterium]
MVSPAARPASYEDILALPDHVIGEIVDGELHVSPRPAPRHALAGTALAEELGPPFKRGRGGPGGWVILYEPELHLGRDVLVPDLGGWRRERMPEVPVDLAYFVLAPDWVAEVLSPSTVVIDRGRKLAAYARSQVSHVWFVDPIAQTLEVLRLDGETYRVVMVASGDDIVRAEPFDAIELSLAVLWAR